MIEETTPQRSGLAARTEQANRVLQLLRPAMEADGGGVVLARIEGGRVDVRLKGMCLDCPSAPMTLKHGIERTLKMHLPWVTEVRRVDTPCENATVTHQIHT